MDPTAAINLAWVSLSAALVLFMQAGFCLMESGMARSKNSINVAIKNLIDLCVSSLLFWAVGFGLMFGDSSDGWIGTSHFWLAENVDSRLLSFFLFQLVFCGTATTIISGATAERMKFRAYIAISAFVSGILYPVYGHWAWGGTIGGSQGWLAELGFVDFAGSTVVHSIGGWVSLAAIIVLGPRLGRFSRTSRRPRQDRRALQGHDLSMATVGVFVLWFGWFGFNGGSTLELSEQVPLILVNTNLAAAAGGILGLVMSWVCEDRPSVPQLLIGVVAGLVSITASCHIVTPWSAIVIGSIGSVIACGTTYLLVKVRIDDVVGAVPAHAFAGAWGTIAVALMAPVDSLPTGDRLMQFLVQFTGVGVALLWAFGLSLALFSLAHRWFGLRVTPKQERVGLNYSEHGASTAMLDLAAEMNRHGRKSQFDRPVTVDRYTEAGLIAKAYNSVLRQVSWEIERRDRAENRYRDIVENAVEGIFQTTPDGQFQSANPSLLQIYGDASLDALQRRTPNLATSLYVDPSRREDFKRAIAAKGIVHDFRSQVRRADGSLIWVSESARAVKDERGNLLYYEGTVADITDRVDAERLHRERDFAEAANEAKSQFLARMSHEMRTPLGGVINTLDLITDDMPPPQRSRMIEIAKQSAQTLLNLINDVLDLSRIEAGKLDLEPVETEIEQTVRVATEMLYHLARKKGLRLASNVSSQVPSRVLLDGTRLQQVLVNLIGNAIKFTPSGEVTVNVTCVDRRQAIICPSSDSALIMRIEVADSGIGIAADRMEKIFEVFTQADRSTTRRFGGSGLGLAICRQLVELMGGKIGVQPRSPNGTVFWLEVPAEPVASISNLDTSCLSNRRILVLAPVHAETDAMLANMTAWGTLPVHCESIAALRPLTDRRDQSQGPIEYVIADAELEPLWHQAMNDRRLSSITSQGITWIGVPATVNEQTRYLDRPIHASALLNELLTRFSSRPVRRLDNSKAEKPFGDGRMAFIVDDNEVNRMVAVEMMKRMGFEPLAFESALDAIDALSRIGADIVLMDCEMPEMDGLEATMRIRALHRSGALALAMGDRLSIIACTAQAIEADRQRCFDAGMDYYITKPIRQNELRTVLMSALQSEPPIHYEELLGRCGEDPQVVVEVLRTFAKRGPEDVRRVAESLSADSSQISSSAHRIKGAASTLAAHRLTRIADEIEATAKAGKTGENARYKASLRALEEEMNRCVRWIEERLESIK